MAGEVPRPEREWQPRTGLFNVDAMSEDEIVILYRSLALLVEQVQDESGDEDTVGNEMWEVLAADVRGLVARDPERVKNLVHRCTMSHKAVDREFAAYTAASLIDYDYSFTRDALVFLEAVPDRESVEGHYDIASEAGGILTVVIESEFEPPSAGEIATDLALATNGPLAAFYKDPRKEHIEKASALTKLIQYLRPDIWNEDPNWALQTAVKEALGCLPEGGPEDSKISWRKIGEFLCEFPTSRHSAEV
jgi:hypothetical protein